MKRRMKVPALLVPAETLHKVVTNSYGLIWIPTNIGLCEERGEWRADAE